MKPETEQKIGLLLPFVMEHQTDLNKKGFPVETEYKHVKRAIHMLVHHGSFMINEYSDGTEADSHHIFMIGYESMELFDHVHLTAELFEQVFNLAKEEADNLNN